MHEKVQRFDDSRYVITRTLCPDDFGVSSCVSCMEIMMVLYLRKNCDTGCTGAGMSVARVARKIGIASVLTSTVAAKLTAGVVRETVDSNILVLTFA